MKKILYFLLSLLCFVSCGYNGSNFDNDFKEIVSNLKNNNDFVVLDKENESTYDYSFDLIDLGIKAYYTKIKSDYSYAFVLTLDYKSTKIEGIRCVVITINDENTTIAQVGFNKDKKIIDSYNDSANSIYKGIQIFVTPYSNETSITRFYFECTSLKGNYYQVNNVLERE